MHLLRIELGGKGANLLGRDVPRSEAAQRAELKVLESKGIHIGDILREARLWPHFAAISTHPRAWFAFDLPELAFGASPFMKETDRANHIRLVRGKTDVRFSGSVSVGSVYYADHYQDILLACDRAYPVVWNRRHFLRSGSDGDQPLRRVHPAIVFDRQRRRWHHLLAHRGGIRPDRIPHQ